MFLRTRFYIATLEHGFSYAHNNLKEDDCDGKTLNRLV